MVHMNSFTVHRNVKAYVETKNLLNSFVKSLSTEKGQCQPNSLTSYC